MDNKKVLAIGAHPDDIEQFCGGTLLLLKQKGCEIKLLIMTDGACGSQTLSDEEIKGIRKKEMEEGARYLGAEVECLNIRDGCVTYELETVKRLVKVIREFAPSIIFTHPITDYMTDHAHTGRLVLWAAPESTHQNFIVDSSDPALPGYPHVYHTDPQGLIGTDGQIVKATTIVDISEVIDVKMRALAAHESQMDFMKAKAAHDMDSVEMTTRWNATRGQQVRVRYAEGFTKQLLEQYPRHNILKEVLGEKVFTL